VSKLKVIVGSTRENRNAERILAWVRDRTTRHDAFEVEVLDLRDWPLPMFAEHVGTLGNLIDPPYSAPIVKHWNLKIAEGDAYLFITPEYNHSVPGVLKNAIDNVFASFAFRNKPAAFLGYSTGIAAGTRAVEHLALIAIETELVPLRNTVLIPKVQGAFDANGDPVDPDSEVAMGIMLDDLAWWSNALEQARAGGVHAPASVRRRLAAAARAKVE
jgi:NAD(P)H-dependent FMN reductase